MNKKLKEKEYDVVLLDVIMPNMNGYEVCEKIKNTAATAHIPVIMITSLKGRTNLLKGIKAGATDFLAKPVDKSELLFRVRNALFTKKLFDLAGNHYMEIKKYLSSKDNSTKIIINEINEPLVTMATNLSDLSEQLQNKLNFIQKEVIDKACSSIWEVNLALKTICMENREMTGALN